MPGTRSSIVSLAGVLMSAVASPAQPTAPVPSTHPAFSEITREDLSLLKQMGPDLTIHKTPHFVIATDTGPDYLREVRSAVEQTYERVLAFCKAHELEIDPPKQRLAVVCYRGREPYDRYASAQGFDSAGTYGCYFSSTNRTVFFNAANEPEWVQLQQAIVKTREGLDRLSSMAGGLKDRQGDVVIELGDGRRLTGSKTEVETELAKEIDQARKKLQSLDQRRQQGLERVTRMVMRHETAHQVLFNVGVHVRDRRNPPWLKEGLACLFEIPVEPPDSMPAGFNPSRLRDLHDVVGPGPSGAAPGVDDLMKTANAGRLPLPYDLVTEPTLLDERGQPGAVVYAAAWSLAYFLHARHGDALAAYINDVRTRDPATTTRSTSELDRFEHHFGPLGEAFTRRWAEFVLALPAG